MTTSDLYTGVYELINPSSSNHGKFYIQRMRAFQSTVYLYKNGIWANSDAYPAEEAYYDTKEEAFNFLELNPYQEV